MTLSSGEGREVDILQMLTKAKDEYTKVSLFFPTIALNRSDKIVTEKDLRLFESQWGNQDLFAFSDCRLFSAVT